MGDVNYQSMTGAKSLANLRQTDLANSVLHLFQDDGFTPALGTPLADFVTHEATYDTYAAKTIATWSEPILASLPGYNIIAPAQNFALAATPATPNSIGGYFLVHSDGVTLLGYGTFDPARPMQMMDQSVIVLPVIFFPAGL